MKKQGMKSGEENGLDGDYFKARWSDTGVIEADCLLCHMPEYNFKERNKQLANLNFKWAATAGSGFGKVDGSIKDSTPVKVTYDKDKFDEEGRVAVHDSRRGLRYAYFVEDRGTEYCNPFGLYGFRSQSCIYGHSFYHFINYKNCLG
ncbi:MAG: hypothetical protein WA126_03515 [Thermodesulfovibrionales bacterium]